MSAADVEETARLIHMEQLDAGVRDIPAFDRALRAEHPDCSLSERMGLWQKYRGVDRSRATHDPVTGGRLGGVR